MQGSWSLSIFCHKHLFPGEPSAHKIIIITKELCHMVSYDYVTVGWKNAWPWLLFSIKKFSTKCQNLSHQRLKSKQELFSIFWGIFVFVTLELLFQRWIPGFSFETFGYLGFRQINLNNFSSVLNFGIPPPQKRLGQIWIENILFSIIMSGSKI